MPTESAGELVPLPVNLAPVPPTGGLVRAVASVADVVAAQHEYHALCNALLDANDFQRIQGKDFRKKSAWRKLAVAFNVSVTLVERIYERDPLGRIIRAEVVARATAPNGRAMDGIGACDVKEKCRNNCPANCDGTRHFSNPSHDLPATAATRATNRACADLFGMGEVSAEEVNEAGAAQWTEPQPLTPEQWLHANGWTSEQDHTEHRRESDRIARELPEDDRASVRQWVTDHTDGFKSLWTINQAAAYRSLVTELQTAQEARAASPAPETAPEATSPAPAPENAESEPYLIDGKRPGLHVPDYVQKIIDEVKAMKLTDVRKTLASLGQDDKGEDAVVRHRLAEHLVNNAPESTESF